MTRGRAGGGREFWTAALLIVALWLLGRQYRGITHDARIYMGRALADLGDPGYAADLLYRTDQQTGFTLFRPLLSEAVAWAGPADAGLALAALALALWLAAAWALARQVAAPATALAMLAAVAAAPAGYGAMGVFHFAEAFVTPRPFAELLVLTGLAAILGRRLAAGTLAIAAAMAMHPIMGLAGAGTAAVLLLQRDRRWLWLLGLAPLAAAAAFAIEPALLRAATGTYSGLWRVIVEATDYLYLGEWPTAAWGMVLVQLGTLALGARLLGGRARRLAAAVLLTAIGGLLATLLLVDLAGLRLAVQAQPWRTLWLAAAASAMLLPLLYRALRRDPAGRAAFAALFVAWLAPKDIIVAGLGLALAWVLATRGRSRFAGGPIARLLPAAAAGLGAMKAGLALGTAGLMLANGSAFGQADLRGVAGAAFAAAGALAILAADGGLAFGARRAPRRLATAGAAVLAAVAVLLWDNRSDFLRAVENSRFTALAAATGGDGGELYSTDDGLVFRYAPVWWSWAHGAPTAFSEALALEWGERLRALRRAGFVPGSPISVNRALRPEDGVLPTPPRLAHLCHGARRPDFVVAPAEPLHPRTLALASTVLVTPAPFPQVTPDGYGVEARRRLALFECARVRALTPPPRARPRSAPAPSASGAAPSAPSR